jgi:hypothetical protein
MGLMNAIKNLLGLTEPDPDQVEANAYALTIVRELNRMGKCYLKHTKDGDIFQEVRFKPPLKVLSDRVELEVDAANLPYGVSLSELKEPKIIEGIEAICKRPVSVKHERGAGFWYVVSRQDARKSNFGYIELRPPRGYTPTRTPLLIPIGRDDNGEQIWRDLEKVYHLLIGGATGKGKTSLTHSIICWLLQYTPPSHVQLALIDLKEGLDFSRYNGAPHLARPVAIQPMAAYETLKWVNDEISRRGELFRRVNAENIDTYRKRSGQLLNNIVLIFDEITNLNKLKLIGEPDKLAEAWFYLKDGAQRARALGIHFIISTQRPSVQVIDGDIKMNFTARIGLGTATDVDSRVILDNDMATGLDVGDLVYQDSGNRGLQLRGAYITTDMADAIVRAVIKHYQAKFKEDAHHRDIESLTRQALIERMLNYARQHNDNNFSIDTLYQEFGGEITKDDLRTIAQQLEDEGVLLPASGRKPRTIVVYDLSSERQNGNIPPSVNDNHSHYLNGGNNQ